MKDKILSTVRKLQGQREEAHVTPPLVLLSEIINHGCKNPKDAINELCREGKLGWCRTLNEYGFFIKKEKNGNKKL